MRKIAFILSAAALLFTACEKNEDIVSDNSGALLVNATVEQQEDGTGTKTSLSSNSVVWSSGDQINLFTSAGTYTLTLKSGAGSTSGTFKIDTKPAGDFKYAIYPASANNSLTDDIITFNIPASQTYAAGSFGPGANVAVAKYESGKNLSFTNVCGVLKLQLTGDATVTSIDLTGTSNEVICGKYTADMSGDKPAATFSGSDGGTTITLDCSGEADGGVTLTSTATTFYFVVPVGAFANGFIAQVHTTGGIYIVSSTKTTNTISRSKIRAMPETDFQYQKVEYIESTGTNYINTGYAWTTDKIKYDFEYMATNSETYERTFIGSSNTWKDKDWCVMYSNEVAGRYYWALGSSNYFYTTKVYNSKIHLVLETNGQNATQTINGGTPLNTTYSGVFYPRGEIYLYSMSYDHISTWLNPGGLRFYWVKLTDNGSLQRYFIPAKCKKDASYTDGNTGKAVTASADKPGMYDLVTGKFFVNQGTSPDFTTGPAVTE